MVAISDNDLAAVGVGLYPTNALVNHSCRPNVVPLFDGARLHLQAMERIEPGTELCATYVDLMQPTGARKKALRETYCFECQCPACAAVPLLNDPLETYRCVNADCKGSGFSVPDDLTQSVVDKGPSAEPINIECPDCRSVLLGFQQTITKVLDSQKLYNEAITLSQQAMDDSATARYLDLLQRAHTVQQAHLSPTNAMLYRTSCELVMALCQNGQWKRAMIISNTIIAQQERFLPGAHNPLRGIYLYINARIAAWMDNLEFAIGQLERALTILRVGGTPLRRLIDRAAREHQELQYELRRRAAA